ncbi:GL20736 [Drosophila persimilis]|uniref:GL20736 n=1 Tax=Drosophila persimilis TaxID=7234 RepID=B4H447_DROPE|nr:GL20736 [Drosophila persimilis]
MSSISSLGAEKPPSAMAVAAATNNSPRLVDGIINQKTESSMPPMGPPPEVPSAGLQFPLCRWVTRSRFPPNQSEQRRQCQCHQNAKKNTPPRGIYKQYVHPADAQKFPMQRNVYQVKRRRFPLRLSRGTAPPSLPVSEEFKRFPIGSQVPDASITLTFPELGQIPKRNASSAIRQAAMTTTTAMTRRGQVRVPPAAKAPQEFPIIKKRFVSFPNHHRTMVNGQGDGNGNGGGHGDPSGGIKMLSWPTDVVPTPPPTTTMTQMSRDTIPKIDTDPQWTGGEGAATATNDDDDVHKVFDNELEPHGRRPGETAAAAAALNLNVPDADADAEGVGEQKEIEHQQAENFNDAFGQRHDHDHNDSENDGDGDGDYAMDVDVPKNKHEICEQSKLEKVFGEAEAEMEHGRAEDHNELNMTKEGSNNLAHEEQQPPQQRQRQRQQQQSICLAGEQTIDANGHEATAASTSASSHSNHQRQQQQQRLRRQLPVDLSDARETSPKQVDDPNQIRIPTHIRLIDGASSHVQSEHGSLGSRSRSPSAGPETVTRPNIELLKRSVRAFLAEGAVASRTAAPPQLDFELIDLLTDAIEFLCEPTTTGNLWSAAEPQAEAEAEIETEAEPEAGVGVEQSADMTVSKVSEDRDSETIVVADVYLDQVDQPTEVDDNNNNSSNSSSNNSSGSPVNASSEMKYELKTASTATLPSRRLPTTVLSSTPLSSTPIPGVPTLAAPPTSRFHQPTSRIRNVDAVPAPITPLLLGEQLKRSSASRDDISIDPDSVLPERTRLRRQRRMRSQDSVEEKPEDVIERLNKLKARISGALSEVKGVLKQYSTESEAEAAGEKWLGPPASPSPKPAAESESGAAGTAAGTPPVTFRFVSKVRRRSYFDEAEEEKEEQEQEKEATKEDVRENHVPKPATDLKEQKDEPKTAERQENSTEIKPTKTEEPATKSQDEGLKASAASSEPPPVNGEPSKAKVPEKSKAQAKMDFLAKVQSELRAKSVKEPKQSPRASATPEETLTPAEPAHKPTEEPTPTAIALPNESATQPAAKLDAPASVKTVKTVKKKVVVKAKVNPRRASIAAVEPSKIKIEPAVEQIDALIAQRRPSDSEAIVKRKKKQKLMSSIAAAAAAPLTSGNQKEAETATATATATGTADSIAEETAVKPEPLAIAKSEQLATAEVNAVAAKSETKSAAKSRQGDEAATRPATSATATEAEAAKAQPKRLQIDEAAAPAIANQAPASGRGRRASLKLAELVGETVLVVPASSASAATSPPTTSPDPAATVPAIISSLSESKEPINQSAVVPGDCHSFRDAGGSNAPTGGHRC